MLRKKSARKLARQWKRHTYSALGDFAEKGKLSTDIQDEIKIQFRDHATNNQERAELARPWRYFRQFKEQTRISEVGRCAFPGGYPIVYFHISERGSSADTLCFDCALETAKDIDNGDESGTIDYQTDEESQYHGGTFCEGCNTCIVDPVCCECISELTTKK